MADQENIARAKLIELVRGEKGVEGKHSVKVEFNPGTLKVSYSNQVIPPAQQGAAQEQRGTDGMQFVGKGTTKMSVQLWFDTSALPQATGDQKTPKDVRELTK